MTIAVHSHTEAVFSLGGRFLLEEETVRRDRCHYSVVDWPERAVALRWDEVTTKRVETEGEVFTKVERKKGVTIWRGLEHTVAEVEASFGEDSVLARNMRCNGWATVVETRCGSCHPVGEDAIVIADPAQQGRSERES